MVGRDKQLLVGKLFSYQYNSPWRFFRVVDLDNQLVGVVLVLTILWKVDILHNICHFVNDF